MRQDEENVKKLISELEGFSFNREINGKFPLVWASMWSLEITQMLLNAGAVVNGASSNSITQETALQVAIHRGNHDTAEIVEFLLRRGTDVIAGGLQRTTLCAAVAQRDTRIIELLLKHRAYVNQAGLETPLVVAVEQGVIETIRLLLGRGAYVNQVNNLGGSQLINAGSVFSEHESSSTALTTAVRCQDMAAIKLLLDRGAYVNQLNGEALRMAVRHTYLDAAQMLLSYGADPNAARGKYP
jgi:uncharacterized protein